MKEGQVLPLWTTVSTLSKDHLSICFCKMECKPPCGCVGRKVCCTSMCSFRDLVMDTPNSDQTILNG